MTMFNGYIMVDWSSRGKPSTANESKDAIWTACRINGKPDEIKYHRTREAVYHYLNDTMRENKRLLLGFDFAFGYPEGSASQMTQGGDWQKLWTQIESLIKGDPQKNKNNRFDVAAILNQNFTAEGPFYGNGLKRDIKGLSRTKSKTAKYGKDFPPSLRKCEKNNAGTQEVWKLIGAGSVGGQALTGIACLEKLRHQHKVKVWPFETDGRDKDAQGFHVFAEIFPSPLEREMPNNDPNEIIDRRQVRLMVEEVSRLDNAGKLKTILDEPKNQHDFVRNEEGWILRVHKT